MAEVIVFKVFCFFVFLFLCLFSRQPSNASDRWCWAWDFNVGVCVLTVRIFFNHSQDLSLKIASSLVANVVSRAITRFSVAHWNGTDAGRRGRLERLSSWWRDQHCRLPAVCQRAARQRGTKLHVLAVWPFLALGNIAIAPDDEFFVPYGRSFECATAAGPPRVRCCCQAASSSSQEHIASELNIKLHNGHDRSAICSRAAAGGAAVSRAALQQSAAAVLVSLEDTIGK